jgi:hypothetical protein
MPASSRRLLTRAVVVATSPFKKKTRPASSTWRQQFEETEQEEFVAFQWGAAQPGVAADPGHVAVNLPLMYTFGMAFYPRHETRVPRSPALPAGFAPLAGNLARAAERRVVRPR